MIKVWIRDLLMGVRFAVTGGRPGWTRTLLTGTGVGLGVAVLLLAASVPSAIHAGDVRDAARQYQYTEDARPTDTSVVVGHVFTEYRGKVVGGMLLQPDGDPEKTVTPPGINRVPGKGEIYVSPKLKRMLDGGDGELLAERFGNAKVIGTIGPDGLSGPADVRFYLGTDTLTAEEDGTRTELFGFATADNDPLPPSLLVLVIVMVVVLLLPIAVFIATAVRFGSEGRDRRLAALRLVGADSAMTHRMAAGEAVTGATFGLLFGGLFFTAGRLLVERFEVFGYSVYSADVVPTGWLAALILLLVPASAVMVTLLAMRKVAISPLGVAREGTDRGRRLWWRLVVLIVGAVSLGFFGPSMRGGDQVNEWGIAGGVLLTLVGVTLLLPWAVERVVGRMRGGPLSWQLATRRLQLNSGLAARAVSGVTVAVAGAVALQMLYSSVELRDRQETGQDPSRATMAASHYDIDAPEALDWIERIREVKGVTEANGFLVADLVNERTKPDDDGWRHAHRVKIADCDTLRLLVRTDGCRDGDVFFVPDPEEEEGPSPVRPGDRFDLRADQNAEAKQPTPLWWTVPKDMRAASAIANPMGELSRGLYVTPGAIDVKEIRHTWLEAMLTTDPANRDTVEHVRNLAPVTDRGFQTYELSMTTNSDEFNGIRNALMIGAVVILLLIGASMIVSTIEQLRERKRQLSVLVAFGTKRSTLGMSVLWQTAIPVVLGLVIATGGGIGLGVLLLRMVDESATDWLAFVPLVGAGLLMIALVTLASLPSLWRMMRPDGLRTE
ncbi:ABC transporter permease [Streptomyces alkaliterrae]|uniref:FtsX-like permease family protein n=1 Tax=Streptomyces alkaliterrae TaxID=2213162 RepID=A0A5P0YU46_9ACTN|nr:FtsX-like permease family protein [Streptomyces alkaliterrae]MBB1254718.1 FtsX-like permease family protein [Streptomyces alkaliterrae]MBB1260122.1 FtsX-like permease family protein [Streptomyces alkaliterrae]MQS03834.1 FtsX-like permease family protein [Streptomyces alkaliterrae]